MERTIFDRIKKALTPKANEETDVDDPNSRPSNSGLNSMGIDASLDSFFNGNYGSEFALFENFLLRRKAYVLIDQGRYDEADRFLKDIINRPACRRFAQDELNYLNNIRQSH